MKSSGEEYINVSLIEGKQHKNAYDRLEYYTREYNKILKQCHRIIDNS
jgi:hypothetical protein